VALFTFNEKSKSTNDREKYVALAHEVKGKALPGYTYAMLLYVDVHLLSQYKMAWF
jgi:hypothetical protein